MLWKLRASVGYLVARRLMAARWAVQQPKLWRWMEGQFSRKANLGDRAAQSFYGHMLYFRGHGLGSKQEGVRLLRLAAQAGDAKAAYQLGVISLSEDASRGPDGQEAARWWGQAAAAGHPLAAMRLEQLYRAGGYGLTADPEEADRLKALTVRRGL
ncbi:sel1 repeat family protein [Stutzerimonas stutzeri]|uniref:sel1 repeat family protein n=1 Tax=Stutzerimonas sp. S1 TaxID=3030652 RepID=UPI00222427F3|nr:sel1 repeat family protein [Stutzerimonas sp. S1]MCW3150190.1 sel1 repeat family protein [Stutzerimonas sp. S1]